MKVRNIDSNFDWCFGNSYTDYVKEAYAVAIDIKMRLQEFTNDCFFNLPKGIDWLTRLGSHNQKNLLDNDIQNVVLNTTGVLNIANFESSVSGRKYTCNFNVYQVYSTDVLPITFNFEQGLN